ncbi:MAG: hypothetical protein P9M06_01965 [Candidatus Saelkia tenebricola]|nr:hypothetical protein [Candidatus Saelkia tenebricola]
MSDNTVTKRMELKDISLSELRNKYEEVFEDSKEIGRHQYSKSNCLLNLGVQQPLTNYI